MMRTVATTPLLNSAVSAAQKRAPSWRESWVVLAMLLTIAAFPAIAKYHGVEVGESMSSPAAEVVWSLLYLVAGFRVIALRETALPILKRAPGLVVLLGIFLLSSLWSVAPNTTMVNAIELIGTATIGLYIVCRFTLREFLDILAVAFGVIGIACLGFVFLAPGHGRMDYGSGAWTGMFQEKNNLALTMSLASISLITALLVSPARRRIVISLAVAMCILLLLGSRSATATMAFCAAGAAALGGLALRSERVGSVGRMLIGVALAIAVTVIAVAGVSPDTFLSTLGRDSNLTGRTDFWPYLLQAINDRPLFGYGYDAFFRSAEGTHYLSYYVVESGGWTPYHSHNSFLQCGLDAGLVGLGIFGFVLFNALRGSLSYLWREKSAVAGWPLAIVVYLIVGSFTETYFNQFNTYESILFVTAVFYPLRGIIGKDAAKQRGR
jgi:exopolysaccharide production protein ExoQ